jgi:hypothetical protein
MSIIVAARSKARNVFARSNTGIVASNPTRGIDICVYSVFVLSCVRSGLEDGLSSYRLSIKFIIYSEWPQARKPTPSR